MKGSLLESAFALLFSTVILLAMSTDVSAKDKMSITHSDFGKTPDGEAVQLYTLTNKNGLAAKIMTYGATLVELHTPDKTGKTGDVVLGFDNLEQYVKESPYFGCTT